MTRPNLRHFDHAHLSPLLANISRPFSELASRIAMELPFNAESDAALRKLLEAKDCAVRAVLEGPPAPTPAMLVPLRGEVR
jgi:hypothetical protein